MKEVVSLKQHAELCLNVAIRLALIFWVDASSGYLGKLLCLLCCGVGGCSCPCKQLCTAQWDFGSGKVTVDQNSSLLRGMTCCLGVIQFRRKVSWWLRTFVSIRAEILLVPVSGGGIPVPSRWVLWQLLPGSCSGAANLAVALTLLPHVEANWLDLGWNCSLRSPDSEFCSP